MESSAKLHKQHLPPPPTTHNFWKRLAIWISIISLPTFLLPQPHVLALIVVVVAVVAVVKHWRSSSQVYMVDYSCYAPPNSLRVPHATFIENLSAAGVFGKESLEFMERVLATSGQGERAALPPSLFYIPPRGGHRESLEEVEMVLFPVMESLLSKARLSPRDVDILIVNCSGLCPSPSLSSVVVNRFRLREDVKAFNLSGMGCSASLLAVDLAAILLRVHKNSNAVILSAEILTTGWYPGKEHMKLVLNCVFRMGSAAILLTNCKQGKTTPKYKLVRSIRTQLASKDKAYHSAFREEDDHGITGVSLRSDILQLADEALKINITNLGLSILPMSEKLKYVKSLIKTRLFKGIIGKEGVYVPNFKSVIGHFCFPTTGRRMIEEIAKGLRLDVGDTEAAMATLHRFGNQSSSGLWYELAYLEAKGRVKIGDKVWLLGIGSGVKSSSVVWECIGPISSGPKMGPWADCIDEYPKTSSVFD